MKILSGSIFLYCIVILHYHATGQQRQSDNIVACGGFVRLGSSEASNNGRQIKGVSIDYSKLRLSIILESNQVLVDVTDILPNGAFSLPVYSEDVYRLVLTTPDGWYVSPSEGHLLDVRKSSAACATDFNFHILGFTLHGQVITHGLTTGPSGLHVYLLLRDTTSGSGEPLSLANVTTAGGSFFLAPVLPGDYTLVFSDKMITGASVGPDHSFRARQDVHVDADSLHLPNPIVLLGHHLHGSVTDFLNKPCTGCLIWLLSQSTNLTAIGCGVHFTADRVENLSLWSELKNNDQIACQTRTDARGHFTFERLPGGRYYLLPDHQITSGDSSTGSPSRTINYTFQPEFVAVDMEHNDLDLAANSRPTFTAYGVKLPAGRVLWPNGKPIVGAKVSIVETNTHILTDSDGLFQPGSVQPKQFTILAEVSGALFESVVFNPIASAAATSGWPELRPNRLSVCARFTLPQSQDFSASLQDHRLVAKVLFTSQDSTKPESQQIAQTDHLQDGELSVCAHLPVGQYMATPDVSLVARDNAEHRTALPFTPSSIKLSLSDGPEHLLFTQFRANLTGRLVCLLQSCDRQLMSVGKTLALQLTPVHHNSGEGDFPSQIVDISLVADASVDQRKAVGSTFEFTVIGIPSGTYKLDLVLRQSDDSDVVPLDGWCWATAGAARLLHVADQNVSWHKEPGLVFQQVGYVVHVSAANLRSSQEPGNTDHSRSPQAIGWLRLSDSDQSREGGKNKQRSDKSSTRKQQVLLWRVTEGRSQICVPPPGDPRTSSGYTPSVSSTCVGLHLPHQPEHLDLVRHGSPLLATAPRLRVAVSRLPVAVLFGYPSGSGPLASGAVREPVQVELTATLRHEGREQRTTTLLSAAWSTEGAHPSASASHWLDLTPLSANQDVVLTAHLLARPAEPGTRDTQSPARWHFVHLVDPATHSPQEANLTVDGALADEGYSSATTAPVLPLVDAGLEPQPCSSDLSWSPVFRFPLRLGVVLRGQIVPAVTKVKATLRWTEQADRDQKRADADPHRHHNDPSDHLASSRQPRLLPIDVAEDQGAGEPMVSSDTREPVDSTSDQPSVSETLLPQETPVYTCLSDSNGVFHFGPIALPLPGLTEADDPASLFTVSLDKPGFEFVVRPPSESNNWVFEGMKLSLVEVLVITEDNRTPLPGVLVSIIGESHRENMLTDDDGLVRFVGLAQGQYYIRPMMKEFVFTVTEISPAAKSSVPSGGGGQQSATPIQVVAGGADVVVRIAARRTAFSLFGRVTSLARRPLANVVVEAKWLPEPPSDPLLKLEKLGDTAAVTCQLIGAGNLQLTVPREQAVTDASGVFRLRGLLPGCIYAVQVQQDAGSYGSPDGAANSGTQSSGPVTGIDRVVPPVIHLQMPARDTGLGSPNDTDDSGVVFYAFQSLHMATLTASVDVPDQFRDSLQLTVFRADRPDVVVARHNFSTDSLLFTLSGPTVSGMSEKEYIMRLDCSLSPNAYTGISRQDKTIRMKPGVSEHVRFVFQPVLRQVYSDAGPRSMFSRSEEL